MTQHYREAFLVSDWSQVSAPKNSKQRNDQSTREKEKRAKIRVREESAREGIHFFLCLLKLFQAALL